MWAPTASRAARATGRGRVDDPLSGAPQQQARTAREGAQDERPVEQRAEEIVERVSAEVTRFARRLIALAREEVEDIVAEAQSIRRGDRTDEQRGDHGGA